MRNLQISLATKCWEKWSTGQVPYAYQSWHEEHKDIL